MSDASRIQSSHDVVVVGGGPAGLHAARLLASRGWDVVLFEEHRTAGEPVHCTGVLAAEAYDELDLPSEPILNPLRHVRFFAPSGIDVRYTTPEVEALVIDRRLFDHQLHMRAVDVGVRVESGVRVSDLTADARGITVDLADGPSVRARACVLACGANYTFQRRLGLGLPAAFLQSAQVEWPAALLDTVEVHFGHDIAPRGFAWTVPVHRANGTFARVGLMCDAHAGRHFRSFVARVAGRWGLRPDDGPPGEPRLKMLPLAPLRRTYADRVLAVGDAAGLVKATTGGGIYYSVVSAKLAADVLDDALASDRLTASDLEPYQRAWRKRLGAELQAQLSLRLLANRLSDDEIDALFELARTDGIMPIVRRTAKFNRHRDLIVALLKHPPARKLFFRRLTGRESLIADHSCPS